MIDDGSRGINLFQNENVRYISFAVFFSIKNKIIYELWLRKYI